MNLNQLNQMHSAKGFIAALDQSGGSTPKALRLYGVEADQYSNDDEMFDLIHQMRTRIITSPSFTSEHIVAAILFEKTMDRKIEDLYSADYLLKKGILPILKVDKGLAPLEHNVQLMKPIPNLDELLERAEKRNIFGTKMRSVIKGADPEGIHAIVDQQFEIGLKIAKAGFVPILEPEVDITIPDKQASEQMLKKEIMEHLAAVPEDVRLMFKLSIPSIDGFYSELMEDPRVVRVVALSGGYSREEANKRLSRNPGLIASFSRAFTEGLKAQQTDEEFNELLKKSIESVYEASIK